MTADRSMMRLGITFNVYGEAQGTERIIPFDIIPRVVQPPIWKWMERGLKQRIAGLNAFIDVHLGVGSATRFNHRINYKPLQA